jgi:hypothetical protein
MRMRLCPRLQGAWRCEYQNRPPHLRGASACEADAGRPRTLLCTWRAHRRHQRRTRDAIFSAFCTSTRSSLWRATSAPTAPCARPWLDASTGRRFRKSTATVACSVMSTSSRNWRQRVNCTPRWASFNVCRRLSMQTLQRTRVLPRANHHHDGPGSLGNACERYS